MWSLWGVEDEHQIPGQGVDILGIWWDVTPIPRSPPQFLVGLASIRIKAWTSYCLHWSYFSEFLLLYILVLVVEAARPIMFVHQEVWVPQVLSSLDVPWGKIGCFRPRRSNWAPEHLLHLYWFGQRRWGAGAQHWRNSVGIPTPRVISSMSPCEMGHMILLSFPAISFSPRFEKLKVDLKTGSQFSAAVISEGVTYLPAIRRATRRRGGGVVMTMFLSSRGSSP